MRPAARRRLGYAIGGVLGGALLAILVAPGCEELHAPGPMNAGHGEVACDGCHTPAPGTLRQQLQNAARHGLGLPSVAVDIGYRAVGNTECLACHDRPADRHPVYRFLEPRFVDARTELHPDQCTSCHREHRGALVTTVDVTYCRECHQDTRLADDPLDVSHLDLVAMERWHTCLRCHDYHGNHAVEPPRRLDDMIPIDAIRAYFRGGASPYGEPILRANRPEASTL